MNWEVRRMMSARSSAKISKALIREDLKRYWELPVLSFIVFLFSSISPLMLCRGDEGDSYAAVIREILEGRYLFNSLLLMLVPVISVMLVFSYLNNTGRVLVTHSQPFSRTAMINSHAVSAFLLSALPVAALGIVFLMMAHPVQYPEGSPVNLFAHADVLKWTLEMLLTEIYILSVSILAVVITGTAVHNLIAIIGLNGLIPMMTVYVKTILEIMLYGYGCNADNSDIAWTHKILTFFGGGPTVKEDIVYLAISILLFAAAVLLYRKRRAERTLEGIVFRPFDLILTILFVFAGGIPSGIMFYEITGSGLIGMIGFAAASLICLIICRMIVMKSLRVFNKKTLKILGVYAVISAVLFGAAALDIFGYEDRIPNDADAVSVQIDLNGESTIASLMEDPGEYRVRYIDFKGKDAEKARALHQMLLDHKDAWKDYDRGFEIKGLPDPMYEKFGSSISVNFCYKDPKKHSEVCRGYNIPYSSLLASEEFGELFESDSFRNAVIEGIPKSGDVINVSLLYNDMYTSERIGEPVNNAGKLEELEKALASDLGSFTFEDLCRASGKRSEIQLDITYYVDGRSGRHMEEKFIAVTGENTDTLKWISENICDPQLLLDRASETVDKAVIYNIRDRRPEGTEHESDVWYEEGDPAVDNAYMVIDDKALMPAVYEASSGLANVENTDSEKSGIYYIELLSFNSEWKQTDGGCPYDLIFEGYIKKNDLERITGGKA